MPSNSTIDRRGVKSVSVRGTGCSQRATVLLGVSMDGEKLPPFIVFTGTRNGRVIREVTGDVGIRGFPTDVVMTVQKKAWVDNEVMLEWIEKVWRPWVASKFFDYSYLIMDCFKVHMQGNILDALASCKTEAEFVVAGYTSKLQVLDVGVNRPFKVYLSDEFNKFVIDNPAKNPSRQHVAMWISHAWKNLKAETILNTWRHVGFNFQ
uniref:DDE-1 domain-containing protein n=2 Tax=Spongospora subterranea TaxID=70186 RepID=A0A0H5RFJ9_9EUKA|eukprot:CRZ07429.1 hypothetical protein [Spongospora subterranea]